MDSQKIFRLFENVLFKDLHDFCIAEEDIKIGIESMRDVYKPDMSDLTAPRSSVADYRDPAHRCAYLHKYAAFHTAMVRDFFYRIIHHNYRLFYHQVFSEEQFSVCCLGGGPGNDVVAVLAALHHVYSYFPVSATIIDYMESWKYTFSAIMQELGSGNYGAFGNNTSYCLDWRYLGANLLRRSLQPEVEYIIKSASLVTMVKFVSATSCKDTQQMIDNIFYHLKPGAIIMYIDNDGGGYHELIRNSASKYNFQSIFGPLRHEEYLNVDLKIKRFGTVSCHRTVVTVHVLMKPLLYNVSYAQQPVSAYLPQYSWGNYSEPHPANYHSPLTPQVYVAGSYSRDEVRCPTFSSPVQEIPQVQERALLQTPLRRIDNNAPSYQTPGVCKRTVKVGCLPVHRWRHHMVKKIQNVKYRAKDFLVSKRLRF